MNTEDKKTEQNPLPADFEKQMKERFDKLDCAFKGEFLPFLEKMRGEFNRAENLKKKPSLAYKPELAQMTPCGNGDFEATLDSTEWQGAFGTITNSMNSSFPFSNFSSGLSSGIITAPNAHQTWVSTATDPNAPISTTAPGSSGAVRIGNQETTSGSPCSILSKTFIVTPANAYITFWYAVVMDCPDGGSFFKVRVSDAMGNEIPNSFDFGNGSNQLTYVASSPIWADMGGSGTGDGGIVYKDWSCAQIDLSKQVDTITPKVVTVEFIVSDCAARRWAYAYIDNFCGNCKGSPTGHISYNCEGSSHCGEGKICFDYELPVDKKDPQTGSLLHGSVVITLDIYQNGSLVTSLSSPAQTSGTNYCFSINPASVSGLDLSLGGFDFIATGEFFIGSLSLGKTKMGSAPDGMNAGQNNDYMMACRSCSDIRDEQNAYLAKKCASKMNTLASYDCNCPSSATQSSGGCGCGGGSTTPTPTVTTAAHASNDDAAHNHQDKGCIKLDLPKIKPCISVTWGDSKCDCLETDDVEVLCITVCNCYENITFDNLSIGQIHITNMDGTPVPTLPDGTPSVQVIPSGPICFGDIPPCKDGKPSCVTRELVLYTRGAVGKDYRLSFEGICYSISSKIKSKERCFVVNLCKDE